MQNHNDKQLKNNIPTILVVFGINGDLATRKIIPSLWRLFEQNLLGDRFSVIGFSRGDALNDKFKSSIASAVRNKSNSEIRDEKLSRFTELFSYHAGKFEDAAAFRALAQSIGALEKSWGVCANKLFYLAAPPATYKPIFENLAGVKLNLPCGSKLGWSRLLIEKPFGTDLMSAQSLQSLLAHIGSRGNRRLPALLDWFSFAPYIFGSGCFNPSLALARFWINYCRGGWISSWLSSTRKS